VVPRRTGISVKHLPTMVQKRFRGKCPVAMGARPVGPCYRADEPLTLAQCPDRLRCFIRWARDPASQAQRDRRQDRHALHTARLDKAPTLGNQLLGLLAFFWLRVDIVSRIAVAAMLCSGSVPMDWGKLHAELATAKRQKNDGSKSIRRGWGAWRPSDVRGLTAPQREVATLRAWSSCVTASADPTDGLNVHAALEMHSSGEIARYLATLPGVGRYLAVKVLYGMELLGSLSFDHGIVGPGALEALCHVWAASANNVEFPNCNLGLWPWEYALDVGLEGGQAQQARAAVRQAAFLCGETWLFTQVSLCVWKMRGFPAAADEGDPGLEPSALAPSTSGPSPKPVPGPGPRRRLTGKQPQNSHDCGGSGRLNLLQQCRMALRAAFRVTETEPNRHDKALSRRRRLDFAADAVAAAAAGAESVRGALLAACGAHFAAGHFVALRAVAWPLPGYDEGGRKLRTLRPGQDQEQSAAGEGGD